MQTITTSATIFDNCGYITAENVTICDHGDRISIGSAVHNKSDLTIGENNMISEIAGWSAIW